MEELRFKAGDYIFREGEESDWAYIIKSGKVDIFQRFAKGTVLLATLGQGEMFGEMGIISDEPRSASAVSDAMTVVQKVSRESLGKILQGEPPEVVLVVNSLMERLREANQKISRLMNKHAEFQLGASLNEAPAVNRVSLIPMTNFLKKQMSPSGMMISLPFRVGALPEGAEENPLDYNNLAIRGADMQVMSRNHFSIQRGERGLSVVDRGSRTGTSVNGEMIGGGSSNYKADLNVGDNEICAGGQGTEYRFCLCWE